MKNLEVAIPTDDDIGVSTNRNLQKRIVIWITAHRGGDVCIYKLCTPAK